MQTPYAQIFYLDSFISPEQHGRHKRKDFSDGVVSGVREMTEDLQDGWMPINGILDVCNQPQRP